jgi:hypothetical protein
MAVETGVKVVLNAENLTGAAIAAAEKNLKRFADSATKVGREMVKVGTITVGAFALMAKTTADYGEEHLKVAKQTGLTVEQSQRLAYAAEQEEASFEGLTKGLKFLSKNMYDANNGTGAAKDVFREMGIELTNTDGSLRSVNDVLLDVSDYMSTNTDEVAKGAMAMKVFGRSGNELIPFLESGRENIMGLGNELEKTRGVMSRTQAETMDKFNDSLNTLKAAFSGVKQEIAIGVMPIFESFIAQGRVIAQWFRELDPEMKTFLSRFALIAGIGGAVLGTGLLVIGMLANTAVSMITLAKATGLMNAAGGVNIAVLTGMAAAAGKLLLITIGLIAAEEALMALKGIREAKGVSKAAGGRMKGLGALEASYQAGEITREEYQSRVRGYGPGAAEKKAYGATWGMTGMERAGYEIGRFQQIQANISVTKESEIGGKVNQVMQPILAGT